MKHAPSTIARRAHSSSSFSVADEFVSSLTSEIEVNVNSDLVEQLAADNRLPAWQVDELADALGLALDRVCRYVEIEPRWSSEAFRDMQDFAWSLENPAHRQRLDSALGGKGSFRRFSDALDHMPDDIRRQWFAFRDARAREDIVDWLRSIGIEPIDTPTHQGPMFSINKTCRFCAACDLLIVHQHELEAQLAIALPQHGPQAVGNPYTVVGTLDRADWKRMRGGVSDPREFTNAVSIFKQIYNLEFRPAHWAPASEPD